MCLFYEHFLELYSCKHKQILGKYLHVEFPFVHFLCNLSIGGHWTGLRV